MDDPSSPMQIDNPLYEEEELDDDVDDVVVGVKGRDLPPQSVCSFITHYLLLDLSMILR